jgi:spore coat protein A, manganese oxidase
MPKISRRRAIQLGGLAAGGAIILPVILQQVGHAQVFSNVNGFRSPRLPPFYARDFQIPPVLRPVRRANTPNNLNTGFQGTDFYQTTMQRGTVEILPGIQTEIWGYNGITPGATIRQQLNRQSVVRHINNLGTDSRNEPIYTSVHLHGSASLPQYDGWADDITLPGFYKDYIYPNNRAATIWYHDHGVHRTSVNAYMGLAAMYIIEDPNEKPDIPKGEFDIPLMLGDKLLDNDGQLVFADNGHVNFAGDVILVNGVPWPRMAVRRTKYRFRLLNTGISRAYQLRLSNGASFTMIATDAGLLESPVSTQTLTIGVAERYEFVIDFANYQAGTQIEILNDGLRNHPQFPSTVRVMRFDVVGNPVANNPPLPVKLRTDNFNFAVRRDQLVAQAVRRREFVFERRNGMWTINGRVWADGGLEANPGLGDVEIWQLVNNGGGWNHPIHIHLVDLLMVSRTNGVIEPYQQGFKDVFFLRENQVIEVVAQFGPNRGKYMFHCHNLVHEDNDMMRAFEVGQGGPDPVTTAPPRPFTADVLPL